MAPGAPRCFYLAGPMRGRPRFGFDDFRAAREALRAIGLAVFCPAERDEKNGFDPARDAEKVTPEFLRAAMRENCAAVLEADAVAVLPGFEPSAGATLEAELALMCGLPVYRVEELLEAAEEEREPAPMRFGGDARFLALLRELAWLHRKKGADYGVEGDSFANVRSAAEFGVAPWVGTMIRAHDKVVRLKAAARGSRLQNEGVEDSLIDLGAYSLISLVLFREENGAASS